MAQLRRCRNIMTSSVSSVSSEASERVSVHMLPVDVQGVRPRLSCGWCMWGQGGRLRGQGGRPGRQAVGPGRQAWNQWGQGGRLWDVGSSRVTRANMRARTHMQHVHAHACPHRHTHKHTDTCAQAHTHTLVLSIFKPIVIDRLRDDGLGNDHSSSCQGVQSGLQHLRDMPDVTEDFWQWAAVIQQSNRCIQARQKRLSEVNSQ